MEGSSGRRSGPRLFAGLDVSTQGCKLVVIDPDDGRVVHVDALAYDRDLPAYGTLDGVIPGLPEGVRESDPRMWIEAVDRLLSGLATALPAREIRCLSVSAQMHGLVALDAEGRLARARAKLWNDTSTARECRDLTAALGGVEGMIDAVGNTQRPGYTAPKILHLRRHDPEAYARAATLFVVHDWVNWYLTGGVRATDAGDASGLALWHPVRGEYSRELLEAIAPDLEEKLPAIHPVDECVGTLAPGLAERFGLSPECRIDAGCGDNMYGALGTGAVREGVVTVTLGTSGTVACHRRQPFVDPRGEIACYRDATGGFLSLLCVSNLAGAYNELRRSQGLGHGEFEARARAAPRADRVLLPWFIGERTPDLPDAAPVWFGFPLDGLDGAELCRALLDGLVLNLHAGAAAMPAPTDVLRVTGGLARSDAWCQTLADVFEAEVVPVKGEGAALGAALHAAWVWSRERGEPLSLEELVDRFVELDEERRRGPREGLAPVYRDMRRLFAAVRARLRSGPGEDPFALRRGPTDGRPTGDAGR